MYKKLRTLFNEFKLTMRMKLVLSLSAIAITLLVSSTISVMEYGRMSHYVSNLIADNINSINVAQRLSDLSSKYNLEILAVIGDDHINGLPRFNQEGFLAHCDSLKSTLESENMQPLVDSVLVSYSAYMQTSEELSDVLLSDFIDSRTWFFEKLQPKFVKLNADINKLADGIYNDLKLNSVTFDRGFYRSIVPGIVAVGVGLLLILLLLFFILVYYIGPFYKMLHGLSEYRALNKRYDVKFDGDDELKELSDGISELVEENRLMQKRVKDLRDKLSESRV